MPQVTKLFFSGSSEITSRFQEAMEELPVVSHVVVGVSGGIDSMVLLHLAEIWCRSKGVTLTALTVDHGLRAESRDEAERVGTWARSMGIDHHILSWEGSKPKTAIQEEARRARYGLMTEWILDHGAELLLTGHHQDDQRETVLMRLLGGSGVDGLGGMMLHRRIHPKISHGRPLLNIPKKQLESYGQIHRIPYVQDPSNEKDMFQRNRLRHFLAQEDVSRMDRGIQKFQEDGEFLGILVDDFLKSHALIHPVGYVEVDHQAFVDIHRALGKRVLSKILSRFSPYPLGHEKISNLWTLVQSKNFSPITLGGFYVCIRQKKVHFQREIARLPDAISCGQLSTSFVWDRRFQVTGVPGDMILAPVGTPPIPFLKKQVISEIPSIVWPTLPAFYMEGTVVAVPQLGYTHQDTIHLEGGLAPIFQL